MKAVGQRVKVGESEVSGLLYADDFMGMISDIPVRLQEQIDATMNFARKWPLSANVKKCVVMVCNDSEVQEVHFKKK